MRILIFDPVTLRPYDDASLANEALGGTEATVIRIAQALDAQVIHPRRTASSGRYLSADAAVDPTHVISLRHPAAALMMRDRFPDAAHVLWLHDLLVAGDAADAFLKHGRALAGTDTTIVCVSDFHLGQVAGALATLLPDARFPFLRRIYNPIADDLQPDGTPVDPDRLVFFSSPHKGLEHALRAFGAMRAQLPSLRLCLANPGYFALPEVAAAGVTVLGSLPHQAMLAHVRGAVATFLPNLVYPETFGLVYAESNAVGTPVLTHPIGAAAEVLQDAAQLVPLPAAGGEGELPARYLERIAAWRAGARPVVSARPAFRMSAVREAWRALLAEQG